MNLIRTRRGIAAAASALVAIAAGLALMVGLVGGTASGQLAAKKATVKIKGFKYHPKPLKVKKGTKVVFTNKDGATHTATDKGVFNTGKIKHNKSASIKFTHKGTYKYICTIHPFMKGTIVVK
jgi:plastocyanin